MITGKEQTSPWISRRWPVKALQGCTRAISACRFVSDKAAYEHNNQQKTSPHGIRRDLIADGPRQV